MAHLSSIYSRICSVCGTKATKELFNSRNAHIADYCYKHGKIALRRQMESEGFTAEEITRRMAMEK